MHVSREDEAAGEKGSRELLLRALEQGTPRVIHWHEREVKKQLVPDALQLKIMSPKQNAKQEVVKIKSEFRIYVGDQRFITHI